MPSLKERYYYYMWLKTNEGNSYYANKIVSLDDSSIAAIILRLIKERQHDRYRIIQDRMGADWGSAFVLAEKTADEKTLTSMIDSLDFHNPTSTDIILRLSYDQRKQIRWVAVLMLSKGLEIEGKILSRLKYLLKHEPDGNIQAYVAYSLGKRGAESISALQLLKDIVGSPASNNILVSLSELAIKEISAYLPKQNSTQADDDNEIEKFKKELQEGKWIRVKPEDRESLGLSADPYHEITQTEANGKNTNCGNETSPNDVGGADNEEPK